MLYELDIADVSGIERVDHRVAFDGWYSWAVEAICDWAQNIYQGVSYGDHAGTCVDMPTPPYKPELKDRLEYARQKLHSQIGVEIGYQYKWP